MLPLLLATLALFGFVYSAVSLLRASLASVGVLIGVAIVYGLVQRWFRLGAARLALRRLDRQREEGGKGSDSDAAASLYAEEDVAHENIGEQAHRLLRALTWILMTLGLLWVWADVLPAFGRLNEIVLWHSSGEAVGGVTTQIPITLSGVLLAMLISALTYVTARNLPSLVEVGLQAKTNIDASLRYAITTVCRYAIVFAGGVYALSLLGLRWSQLQWLAAALTVGLGFGLQEIFANFISGLILLFERPFRIGDVITVDELYGTVTRIRTRATTVLDFDHKEIVIPNKRFITGQLVNWTLSNATMRISVPIGVAYGTEPAVVHSLLTRAARESPHVLDDPKPESLFMGFGTHALQFELREVVSVLTLPTAWSDRLR